MDRRTRAVYESRTRDWIARRDVDAPALRRLEELTALVRSGARVADLGCGPGWYGERLRRRGCAVVGLDASQAMLRAARRGAARLALVRGDLAHLPFARGALEGVWAKNSYIHLPMRELPGALADLHRALRPGAPLALSLLPFERARPSPRDRARGWVERRGLGERPFQDRLFTLVTPDFARDLFEGAGFRVLSIVEAERLWVRARRARRLPDRIRPGLRVLVVGLNPSPPAAATGVAFAGANNRFWPAAVAAGWVARERDPAAALRRGVGFTDLAKRVTAGASEIRPEEYRQGLARVARLVRAFRPRGLLFVGLEGFRRALDPGARPGVVRGGFAGRPAYLAPSTSGRNAATPFAELVRHFRRARSLGE